MAPGWSWMTRIFAPWHKRLAPDVLVQTVLPRARAVLPRRQATVTRPAVVLRVAVGRRIPRLVPPLVPILVVVPVDARTSPLIARPVPSQTP